MNFVATVGIVIIVVSFVSWFWIVPRFDNIWISVGIASILSGIVDLAILSLIRPRHRRRQNF